MKLWNISKNRFYENAWLGFSHCSEIFWKLFLAFIGLFSQILGLVHLNLWCPFYVRNFSKFWVKVSIYIWVLSQLMGWILILWIFNDNSRNSAYFLHLYTLELPKLLNFILKSRLNSAQNYDGRGPYTANFTDFWLQSSDQNNVATQIQC